MFCRSETLSAELDRAAAALDEALSNSSRLEEELAATGAELEAAASLSSELEAQLGSAKEELDSNRLARRRRLCSSSRIVTVKMNRSRKC